MAVTNIRPAQRNYHYEQLLTEAVQQRHRVRLRYHLDLHYRVFEPYIIYKDDAGRYVTGGRRVRDESKPTKAPSPRKFEIGLITDMEVLNEAFPVDTRFRSKRSKYAGLEILCAIDR